MSFEGPAKKNAMALSIVATIMITLRSIHLGKMNIAKLPGIEKAGKIMKK